MTLLSNEQILFNQRLLSEHCVTEERARELWRLVQPSNNNNNDGGGRASPPLSLEESLGQINRHMHRVGLEVRGLSVEGRRYYAWINTNPDAAAASATKLSSPGEALYVRAVLQLLASVSGGDVAAGIARADLLNARDKHLTLPAAEAALDRLVAERWLKYADTEGALFSSSSSSSTKRRRRVTNASKLVPAPRTFLELGYLLVDDFGMDQSDLPQIILHQEDE